MNSESLFLFLLWQKQTSPVMSGLSQCLNRHSLTSPHNQYTHCLVLSFLCIVMSRHASFTGASHHHKVLSFSSLHPHSSRCFRQWSDGSQETLRGAAVKLWLITWCTVRCNHTTSLFTLPPFIDPLCIIQTASLYCRAVIRTLKSTTFLQCSLQPSLSLHTLCFTSVHGVICVLSCNRFRYKWPKGSLNKAEDKYLISTAASSHTQRRSGVSFDFLPVISRALVGRVCIQGQAVPALTELCMASEAFRSAHIYKFLRHDWLTRPSDLNASAQASQGCLISVSQLKYAHVYLTERNHEWKDLMWEQPGSIWANNLHCRSKDWGR